MLFQSFQKLFFQKGIQLGKLLLNPTALLHLFLNYNRRLPSFSNDYFLRIYFTTARVQTSDDLLVYFRSRNAPKLFPCNDIQCSHEERMHILSSAEEILQHTFTVLGVEKNFTASIDWSSDFSDKTWMHGNYRKLNSLLYRNDFLNIDYIGDVKIPWEFNKHSHFVRLGQAYALTQDEKYAKEFISQISDWIDQNPVGMNLPWTQTLIVAQRAISWCFALSFFLLSPSMTGGDLLKILKAIAAHAFYIEANLEVLSDSNHAIGNIAGLFLIAAFFPEFKDSKRWEKFSLKFLRHELERQLYPDGVDYEQSIHYHKYIADFSMLFAIFFRRNQLAVPQWLSNQIENMLSFLMHMTQPNGHVQPIGDADGARVWNFYDQDITDYRQCLALGAFLFSRGDFKYVAGENFGEIGWFFGKIGMLEYQKIKPCIPSPNSFSFPHGGYYIMRTGWHQDDTWIFFDCGQIGSGKHCRWESVSSHGHDDILNFGFYAQKQIILTDSGSYTYTGDKQWHDYFRSSKKHNLVIVDQQDESIHTKTWTLENLAKPFILKWHTSSDFDYVSGGHTGYLRLKEKVLIKRHILFLKISNKIIIKDEIESKGSHQVDIYFHLFPGLEPVRIAPLRYMLYDKILLSVFLPYGEASVSKSWHAVDYGSKTESKSICYAFKTTSLKNSIYTLIDLNTQGFLTEKDVDELFNGIKFL